MEIVTDQNGQFSASDLEAKVRATDVYELSIKDY
jgi:hypothetical protein